MTKARPTPIHRALMTFAALPLLLASCSDVVGPTAAVDPARANLSWGPDIEVCAECVIGPVRISRSTGTPEDRVFMFVAGAGEEARVVLRDAGGGGANARVWLNGEEVVVPQSVAGAARTVVEIPVTLAETNRLVIRQTGKPGSLLDVRVTSTASLVPVPFPTADIPIALEPSAFGLQAGSLMAGSLFSGDQPGNGTIAAVRVRSDAPQLLFLRDDQASVRGLSLSVPGGPPAALPGNPTSTSLALLFLTPGIATDGPGTGARLAALQQLSCFPGLEAVMSARLATLSLPQALSIPEVSHMLAACVEEFFSSVATMSALTASAPVVQSGDGLTFTRSPAAAPQTLTVVNRGWRFVEVYRRDVDGPLASDYEKVMEVDGASTLSPGSIFRSFDIPGQASDPTFAVALHPMAEYWVLGPGLGDPATGAPQLPPAVHAYGRTAWTYFIEPLISVVGLDRLPLPEAIEAAPAVLELINAQTPGEVSQASLSLAGQVFKILAEDEDVAAHFGVQPLLRFKAFFKAVNLSFLAFNTIGMVDTWAHVSRASLFTVPRNVAYRLLPLGPVAIEGQGDEPQVIRVRITDMRDEPVRNATVRFSASAGALDHLDTTTDAEGEAAVIWTLPATGDPVLTVTAQRGNLQVIGSPLQVNATVSSTSQFRHTAEAYEHPVDMSAVCRDQFGAAYRIADWTDITLALSRGTPKRDIGEGHFWVTRSGQPYWSYPRHYIASSEIHPGYLAHDSYQGQFWLGSWYATYQILCFRPATRPEDGLVALYDLDGDFRDGSGRGNHGAGYGSLVSAPDRKGVAGKALEFTGTQYGIIPSNAQLKDLTSELTLSLWMRRGSSGLPQYSIPVSRREFGNRIHFSFYLETTYGLASQCCSFGLSEGGAYYAPLVSNYTLIGDGRWHHVAVTQRFGNAPETKLYVDGEEVPGAYYGGSADRIPAVMDADLYIGRQASTSPGIFVGVLDELRIYARALSADEVRALAR